MSVTENLLPFRVAVIVVNWNGKDYTLECLQSLQAQERVEIEVVIVDNASTDGSIVAVRKRFPDAVVIESKFNLGYAAGNNLGLTYALDHGFEYVFVLNNDTVLAVNCVYGLVSDLRAHPDAAAAAPKSYYLDMPDRIYFAGGKIGRDGRTLHIGDGCCDGPLYSRASDPAWINGCAMMFRSSALREIGLFEPRFFLMCEDADWSLRARKAGYRLRFVPDAILWHKVSPSFGPPKSPVAIYYYTRNRLLWIERNFPMRERLVFYWFAFVWACFDTIFRAGDPRTEIGRQRRSAICKGVSDYLSRKFGPQTTV